MTVSRVVRRTPRPVDRRGFSLLELLLVIMLIAALGALVLPSALQVRDAASWSSDRLRLQATLADARLAAMDTGNAMLVRFESPDRLRVRPFSPTATEDDEALEALIDVPFTLVVPEDEDLPLLLAVLLPDGQARLHRPIVLMDEAGHRAVVRLDALTGRVDMLELPPERAQE